MMMGMIFALVALQHRKRQKGSPLDFHLGQYNCDLNQPLQSSWDIYSPEDLTRAWSLRLALTLYYLTQPRTCDGVIAFGNFLRVILVRDLGIYKFD